MPVSLSPSAHLAEESLAQLPSLANFLLLDLPFGLVAQLRPFALRRGSEVGVGPVQDLGRLRVVFDHFRDGVEFAVGQFQFRVKGKREYWKC